MNWISRITGAGRSKYVSRCPLTKEVIEPGFGYLLTTGQIISSKKFWDVIMTEPETLSYSLQHFNNETTGTHMRSLIFEKQSSATGPWLISDTCIDWFDVDRSLARNQAQRWWQTAGKFIPCNSGPAVETLSPEQLDFWKTYAILEAGREITERLNRMPAKSGARL
ncbi:MAG: hypothetical protein N2044_01650 [Cyclobacteriaceae bacterium]|nr:hypothetical protein [Cyclobacteriaceae bacterium]MCX7636528.1 hypothetical protein [Cyclobacteriaceae bacterium]MDW8330103.1 hypothetical protein [Cyclobacteriaceae bacterium]